MMRHKLSRLNWVVALLVTGFFAMPEAGAQNPAPPSLKEQLEAQYQVTKVTYSSGQVTVTQPGTVLVIQKEGVQGYPPENVAVSPAVYKDGVLHKPGGGSKFLANLADASVRPNSETSGSGDRPLPVGDKVYVTKIDVNLKKDRIGLGIIECDACNGSTQTSSYKALVNFHFPKGSLESASLPQVLDTIAQVFAIDTGPTQAQAAQPAETAAQQAPQPEQPAPPAAAQPAGAAPLTNDDVLKLLSIKLGDSVIVAKIKASPTSFDTSTDALAKLKGAGASDPVLQAMIEAGGAPAAPAPPAAAPAAPTPPAGAAAPDCADYQSCLSAGVLAKKTSQLVSALSFLQKASSLDPSKPDPLYWEGRVYLDAGQYEDSATMWDKALALGGTLVFDAWHYKGFRPERGTFKLGPKEVSFAVPGKESLLSAAPAELSSVKAALSHVIQVGDKDPAWIFSMKAGGRNYTFAYGSAGCQGPGLCFSPTAYDREKAVAEYVQRTIAKLTSGGSGK